MPSDSKAAQDLCVACGLCCTGVWFSHVNLEADEADKARAAGLEVEVVDGLPRSLQSCAAHRDGRCSAYGTWRPNACVDFKCKLLADFEEGQWTLEQAIGHVRAARGMAARIHSELGETPRGLLGKRFLMRVANEHAGKEPAVGPVFSPAAQLDAVALNRYYEKYFRNPSPGLPDNSIESVNSLR